MHSRIAESPQTYCGRLVYNLDMPNNIAKAFVAFLILIPPAFASAQSGGTATDPTSTGGGAPAPAASTTAATSSPSQAPQATLATPAQPRSTSKATSTIPPRSVPIATPVTSTNTNAITALAEPTTTASTTSSSTGPGLNLLALAGIAVLGALSALGVQQFKKTKQNTSQQNDDGRCDNVKQLLDQKKKELENMMRGWPEEKIKAMAQEKALEALKQNDTAKETIEAIESAKAKYDKLQTTIDILEKRLDLCMLSIQEKGEKFYEGTIVENSLTDAAILENIKIVKTYTEGELKLHDVSVNEKQIKKLGEYLNDGPWYMHFWIPGKDDVIALFKDKRFSLKQSDETTWHEAIAHGKTKGIPEAQLNFKIK